MGTLKKNNVAPARDTAKAAALRQTPLYNLHQECAGVLAPFAGYAMPLRYAEGSLAEHHHTRSKASLFDVSHMGQMSMVGDDISPWLETLLPSDIGTLQNNHMRYSLLLNSTGGILDDLMVTRLESEESFFLVVNASEKHKDLRHFQDHCPATITTELLQHQALLALQGPWAARVLAGVWEDVQDLPFMQTRPMAWKDVPCRVSRCGYTGEDGFEISLPASAAEDFARLLLKNPQVKLAGLIARDLLRLEAGLCLYGQDINADTTPVQANLTWVIGKHQREKGAFLGADTILKQLSHGCDSKRLGYVLHGPVPARSGAVIENAHHDNAGLVTSGAYSPVLKKPIAMGYVTGAHSSEESFFISIRGKRYRAQRVKMPFVGHKYYRPTLKT